MSTTKWLKFRKEFLKGKLNYEGYYECVHCGKQTVYIEVDHILKRSTHPDLVYEPSNLQLLCNEPPNWCHAKKDGGMRVVDSS